MQTITCVLTVFQCAGVLPELHPIPPRLCLSPPLLSTCRMVCVILMIMMVIVLFEHYDSITMSMPYDSRSFLTTISFNCDDDLNNLHYQNHHYNPGLIMMMIMIIRSAVRNPLAGKRALRLPLASHHMVSSYLQLSLS